MAVPKKGWRTIAVKGQTYYWRANGTDWGIDVVIVTDAAFDRGKTAQKLHFTLDYDHLRTPRPAGGFNLHQRAAVAPGVVRLAIERALTLSPPFTGDHDVPHVTLPPELLAEVQSYARFEEAV